MERKNERLADGKIGVCVPSSRVSRWNTQRNNGQCVPILQVDTSTLFYQHVGLWVHRTLYLVHLKRLQWQRQQRSFPFSRISIFDPIDTVNTEHRL